MNGPAEKISFHLEDQAQQISFRLAGQFANELKRRATKRGVSPGQYVRQTLIDTLKNDPALETRDRVAELQDELQKLRQEVWSSVAILLTHAGKTNPEAAQNWVKNTLMK